MRRIAWKENPEVIFGGVFFVLLFFHGAWIGLTDDEAYYWVLAQKPALGYAYHPPAVAWLIAISQRLTGWFFGANSAAVVRLPAALCASMVLGLSLRWLRKVGTPKEEVGFATLILLSLAGLFSLSWMMVPDLPLLLGWVLAFSATWDLISGETGGGATFLVLAFGVGLSMLSKYSGVLVAASSVMALSFWARPVEARRGWAAVIGGGCLASFPILAWNEAHEWASILYQIRDRHEQGSLSWIRYARFWVVEAFAAGPIFLLLSGAGFREMFKVSSPRPRVLKYLWVWAGPPALLFGLQPLWSDFKPHWVFVAWWPLMIALAWSATALRKWRGWAKGQVVYGLTLGVFVILSCHIPIGNWILGEALGDHADPRLDVTNDLYGWRKLPGFLRTLPGNTDLRMPVIGGRYQTAAQAYFALGVGANATLLPRDLKSRDEWPMLSVSERFGPEWPRLNQAVLFVADNRYDAPPAFPGAVCQKAGRVEEFRGHFLAKWIDVWKCELAGLLQPNSNSEKVSY